MIMFIVPFALSIIGVIMLRKGRTVIGYPLLVGGWVLAIIVHYVTYRDMGSAGMFLVFGALVIWFIHSKLKKAQVMQEK